MNQAQSKSLRERIDLAERRHRYSLHTKPKASEPAEVAKARKVIKTFEDTQERKENELINRIKLAYRDAEESILFRSDNEALAAVKKFEAMQFAK